MSMLQPGDRVGDWIVESALGAGGTSSVYRCHHVVTARLHAAVKVIKSDQVDSRWFLREIEALAKLRHPAIVGIRNPGIDEQRGLLYLAMELVEGETLRQRLMRGPLPEAEARRVFLGVAEAMTFAHSHRIFHRDLKPANIMLRPDGSPVIVDFGVATDSDAEEADEQNPGTPSYMPPEAFVDRTIDPARADVYAVGVMLYEVLVGKRAFTVPKGGENTTYRQMLAQKLTRSHLDPGPPTPEVLRDIIRVATAPDPEARTVPMADIAAVLRGERVTVEPPALPAPPEDRREWITWIVGGAIAALVLSGIFGGLAWWWSTRVL